MHLSYFWQTEGFPHKQNPRYSVSISWACQALQNLSDSTLMVATLLVSLTSSWSSALSNLPCFVWSCNILLVATSNPAKINSTHHLVILSTSFEQGSKSFLKVSSLLINNESQKNEPSRKLLAFLKEVFNSKRLKDPGNVVTYPEYGFHNSLFSTMAL